MIRNIECNIETNGKKTKIFLTRFNNNNLIGNYSSPMIFNRIQLELSYSSKRIDETMN